MPRRPSAVRFEGKVSTYSLLIAGSSSEFVRREAFKGRLLIEKFTRKDISEAVNGIKNALLLLRAVKWENDLIARGFAETSEKKFFRSKRNRLYRIKNKSRRPSIR